MKKVIVTLTVAGAFALGSIMLEGCGRSNKGHAEGENHEHMEMSAKTMYTCSMHPDIKSDKPGDCPKCGMKLIKAEDKLDNIAKVFTCPMHPEIISDKVENCPKCGMALVEKEGDHDANEHKH